MKKFFTKAMAVAMMMTAGLVSVSCGSEDINNIINNLLPIVQSFLQGQTLTSTGTANFERRWYAEQNGSYVYYYADGDKHDYYSNQGKGKATVQAQGCSMQIVSNKVTLTIDPFTVGGVQISNLSIVADYTSNTETGVVTLGSSDQMYNYSLTRTYGADSQTYNTSALNDYDKYYGTLDGTIKNSTVSFTAEAYIGDECFYITYSGTLNQK